MKRAVDHAQTTPPAKRAKTECNTQSTYAYEDSASPVSDRDTMDYNLDTLDYIPDTLYYNSDTLDYKPDTMDYNSNILAMTDFDSVLPLNPPFAKTERAREDDDGNAGKVAIAAVAKGGRKDGVMCSTAVGSDKAGVRQIHYRSRAIPAGWATQAPAPGPRPRPPARSGPGSRPLAPSPKSRVPPPAPRPRPRPPACPPRAPRPPSRPGRRPRRPPALAAVKLLIPAEGEGGCLEFAQADDACVHDVMSLLSDDEAEVHLLESIRSPAGGAHTGRNR